MPNQPASKKLVWTRPQLVRLGTIRDVAGNNVGPTNNGINTNRT